MVMVIFIALGHAITKLSLNLVVAQCNLHCNENKKRKRIIMKPTTTLCLRLMLLTFSPVQPSRPKQRSNQANQFKRCSTLPSIYTVLLCSSCNGNALFCFSSPTTHYLINNGRVEKKTFVQSPRFQLKRRFNIYLVLWQQSLWCPSGIAPLRQKCMWFWRCGDVIQTHGFNVSLITWKRNV